MHSNAIIATIPESRTGQACSQSAADCTALVDVRNDCRAVRMSVIIPHPETRKPKLLRTESGAAGMEARRATEQLGPDPLIIAFMRVAS